MTRPRKLFSVCIPAYNRPHYLGSLLDSIFAQEFHDFEIVICEDKSPQRNQIAAVVRQYQSRYPEMLRYFENEENLGYDANVRTLVQKASGKSVSSWVMTTSCAQAPWRTPPAAV